MWAAGTRSSRPAPFCFFGGVFNEFDKFLLPDSVIRHIHIFALYAHARAFVSGLAIKNCTSASALSPRLPLERRESGCKRVHMSDSLDTLMQEERAHFRVDAIGG